jgi:hypothetical protein
MFQMPFETGHERGRRQPQLWRPRGHVSVQVQLGASAKFAHPQDVLHQLLRRQQSHGWRNIDLCN